MLSNNRVAEYLIAPANKNGSEDMMRSIEAVSNPSQVIYNLLLDVYFKRKAACWCKLEDPCHADIVSDAADWVYSGDFLKKRMERVK